MGVPKKEQFDRLWEKLKSPVDNLASKLLKPDSPRERFAGYFEGCLAAMSSRIQGAENTKAGKWLFDQPSFDIAFKRIFKPIQPREFAERLADHVLLSIERKIESNRKSGHSEDWMLDARLSSAIQHWTNWINLPLPWSSAVVDALREYHHGQAHLLSVAARAKVENYLQHAEELLKLTKDLSTATGNGFWFPTPRWWGADIPSLLKAQIQALKSAHNDGTLYTIRRSDAAAKARIFIANMAIAHKQLLHKKHTQVIADLFYLEGMDHAPTVRTIERIATEAINRNHAKNQYERQLMEARIATAKSAESDNNCRTIKSSKLVNS